MVILRTRNKITDFLMILAWASPFNAMITSYVYQKQTSLDLRQIFKVRFLDKFY